MTALERFAALPQGRLERTEKLEQLRLLENAIPIHVAITSHTCHGWTGRKTWNTSKKSCGSKKYESDSGP